MVGLNIVQRHSLHFTEAPKSIQSNNSLHASRFEIAPPLKIPFTWCETLLTLGPSMFKDPPWKKSFKTNFSKTPTSSPLQPGCICLQAHHAVLAPAPTGLQTWRTRFYFLSLKLSQSHLAHPHLSLGDRSRRRGGSPIYIFQFVFFFNLKLLLILF